MKRRNEEEREKKTMFLRLFDCLSYYYYYFYMFLLSSRQVWSFLFLVQPYLQNIPTSTQLFSYKQSLTQQLSSNKHKHLKMLRDVCFLNSLRLECLNEGSRASNVVIKDIDMDGLQELVIFGEYTEITIFKVFYILSFISLRFSLQFTSVSSFFSL